MAQHLFYGKDKILQWEDICCACISLLLIHFQVFPGKRTHVTRLEKCQLKTQLLPAQENKVAMCSILYRKCDTLFVYIGSNAKYEVYLYLSLLKHWIKLFIQLPVAAFPERNEMK